MKIFAFRCRERFETPTGSNWVAGGGFLKSRNLRQDVLRILNKFGGCLSPWVVLRAVCRPQGTIHAFTSDCFVDFSESKFRNVTPNVKAIVHCRTTWIAQSIADTERRY